MMTENRVNEYDRSSTTSRRGQGDHIDESRTGGWSLPENPHDRRRIRNRLIVLAAAVPIVQLLRWLFGELKWLITGGAGASAIASYPIRIMIRTIRVTRDWSGACRRLLLRSRCCG